MQLKLIIAHKNLYRALFTDSSHLRFSFVYSIWFLTSQKLCHKKLQSSKCPREKDRFHLEKSRPAAQLSLLFLLHRYIISLNCIYCYFYIWVLDFFFFFNGRYWSNNTICWLWHSREYNLLLMPGHEHNELPSTLMEAVLWTPMHWHEGTL